MKLCYLKFYMAGNRLPFFCTNPSGHEGPHEWDVRKDQFNVENYKR